VVGLATPLVRLRATRIGDNLVQNRFIRIVAACAVGAATIAACSSSSEPAASTSGKPTDAATVDTVQSTDSSAADPGATADGLEALIVTSSPPGYAQIDDSEADTGPSDLAKAVRDDGGADAEAVLADAGFVSGYQRSWQTEDGSGMIIDFLYQFSKADGAVSYGDRMLGVLDGATGLKAVPFAVDEMPGASGRSLTNFLSDGRLGASVVFSKSGYLVQIVVIGPTDIENQSLVRQIALDQYNRL
jgi:hypothetical protein